MSFKDKIAGCFGSADKIFSGHYFDTQRAKDMLIEALQETESWSEFEGAIRDYLTKQGCTDEHISKQMKKIKDTQSYFNYD